MLILKYSFYKKVLVFSMHLYFGNLYSQIKYNIKIREITYNKQLVFKGSTIRDSKLQIYCSDSLSNKIHNNKSKYFMVKLKKYKMVFDTSFYKSIPIEISLNDVITNDRFFSG